VNQAAKHSVQGRIKIVDGYFVMKSVVQTQQQLQRNFPGIQRSTTLTIKHLLDKFREMGSVQDSSEGRSGRPRSFRTENHIMIVRQMFGAVSREIHKAFVPGHRSFKEFSYAHNASRIYSCFRIRYRSYNFKPMQIRPRAVPFDKPSVNESKSILISWTSPFQWRGTFPP